MRPDGHQRRDARVKMAPSIARCRTSG